MEGSSTIIQKKHLTIIRSVNAMLTSMRRCIPPITFTNRNFKAINLKQDDLMVIKVEIKCFTVKKVH